MDGFEKKREKEREKNGVSRRSERRLRRPLDHEKVKEKDRCFFFFGLEEEGGEGKSKIK